MAPIDAIPIDLFLSPERPFSSALNLLILGLALIALYLAAKAGFRDVRAERRALDHVGAMKDPSRENVIDAVKGSGSLLEARITDLKTLYVQRHPIDLDSLRGLTISELRSSLTGAEGIGRSLIVLGLFGTLWGLGSAVTGLTTTITPGSINVAELANAILGTLSGLQTAFGTTLTGIGGALVVGLVVGVARQQQAQLLRKFEQLMSTRIVPLFDTSDAKNLQHAARALEQMEQRVAKDMLAIIAAVGKEGHALRDRLEADFNRLEDAFQRRAEQLVEATGKALESTLSIIGERAEGEPTLAEYVRTVRSTVHELERSIRTAGSLIPELEQTLLQTIERQRAGLDEVFVRHEQAMQPLLERQYESIDKLAGIADRTIETSQGLAESLARFAAGLDEARVRWTTIDEKVVEVGRSCQEGIQNGLRAVVAELQQDQRAGSEERERLARHLATFEAELQRHMEQVLDERQRAIRQMTELLAVVRDAVANAVLEVGERLGEREQVTARDLSSAVERLSRELRGFLAPGRQIIANVPDGHGPVDDSWDRMSSLRPPRGSEE